MRSPNLHCWSNCFVHCYLSSPTPQECWSQSGVLCIYWKCTCTMHILEWKSVSTFFRMHKVPSLSNCPWGTCITTYVTLLWVFKWRPEAVSMFWPSCVLQGKEEIFPYKIAEPLLFIYFSSKKNIPCIFQCNIVKSSCIFSVVILRYMPEAKIRSIHYT